MLEFTKDAIGGILFPRNIIGKTVMRVPHFPDKKHTDDPNYSLTHAWKLGMIKKLAANCRGERIDVKIISGESTDTETSRYALDAGFYVTAICGDRLASKSTKDEWQCLLANPAYQNRLKLYKLDYRPTHHATLFKTPNKQYIMLEDPHKPGSYYEYALVVEDATPEFVSAYFDGMFERLRLKGTPATKELLKEMPIYA
jgi:hypothetical protein